jgi:glycosyltransferase involved in cell wall biosynthesis
MSKTSWVSASNDNPRIVHLISGLGIGGAERTLQGLVSQLDKRGFESVIISLSDLGEIGRQLQQRGFSVHTLDWKPGRLSPLGLIKLVRLISRLKPKVLQSWMYHADLVAALVSYWIKSINLMWNIRTSIPSIRDLPSSTRVVVRACSFLSSRPEVVIVNSEQGLRDHRAVGYQPKEWIVIHNGIDTQRFVPSQSHRDAVRSRLGIKPDETLLGYVARFHHKKSHRFLIQSFAKLIQSADNYYLALVGKGIDKENDELMSWIQQAGVKERVFLLGPLAQTEYFYPGLDMLALPSQFGEGFPNVVAEAMACGVPCVVTEAGEAPLIVGDTGEIVATGDLDGYSDALSRLSKRVAGNRQQAAQEARDRIVTLFNFEGMLANYEKLYRRMLDQGDHG